MVEGMKLLVLTLVLLRAVYTDVRKGIIDNVLVVFGIAVGLLFSYLEGGLSEVLLSVKMAGIIFAALFFLFVIKGLGAGDIKLFMVLAVFLQKEVMTVVVLSFFAGAVLALLKIGKRFLKKEKWYIKNEKMNFSIPIVIGTVITMLEDVI